LTDLFEQRDKSSPLNFTQYAVLPHNRPQITATSLHPIDLCRRHTSYDNSGKTFWKQHFGDRCLATLRLWLDICPPHVCH